MKGNPASHFDQLFNVSYYAASLLTPRARLFLQRSFAAQNLNITKQTMSSQLAITKTIGFLFGLLLLMSPSRTEYERSLNPTLVGVENVARDPSSGMVSRSTLRESGRFLILAALDDVSIAMPERAVVPLSVVLRSRVGRLLILGSVRFPLYMPLISLNLGRSCFGLLLWIHAENQAKPFFMHASNVTRSGGVFILYLRA